MKTGDIYGGDYLKGEDVKGKGDRVVTISEVTIKEFDDGTRKAVLHFHKTDKQMVLNVTNANILQDITDSDDTDAWVGARVAIYFDPNVMYAGKRTGGLRLKAASGNGAARPAAPPTPPPPVEPLTDDDIPF